MKLIDFVFELAKEFAEMAGENTGICQGS